jgi:hypothetical protein
MANDFFLNFVRDNPPSCSFVDARGLERVGQLLARMGIDYAHPQLQIFKMPPKFQLPREPNGIVAFIRDFDRVKARSQKLGMIVADKIEDWFTPSEIDAKLVQMIILHDSDDGMSHSLALNLQLYY